MRKYQIYINNVNVSNSSNTYGSIEYDEDPIDHEPIKGKITIIKNSNTNNPIVKFNLSGFNSNSSYIKNLKDKLPSGVQANMNSNLYETPSSHFSYLGNNFNDSYYR